MNEDLQKQLADLLASLMSVASDAKQFAATQIPPLVQEKIIYGRVTCPLYLVIAIVVCVAATRFAAKQYKRAEDSRYDERRHGGDIFLERPGGFLAIVSSLVALGSFVGILISLNETALVWFAPRLYVVEWLKGMVTK